MSTCTAVGDFLGDGILKRFVVNTEDIVRCDFCHSTLDGTLAYTVCRHPGTVLPDAPIPHLGHSACQQCADEGRYVDSDGSCTLCAAAFGHPNGVCLQNALHAPITNTLGNGLVKARADAIEDFKITDDVRARRVAAKKVENRKALLMQRSRPRYDQDEDDDEDENGEGDDGDENDGREDVADVRRPRRVRSGVGDLVRSRMDTTQRGARSLRRRQSEEEKVRAKQKRDERKRKLDDYDNVAARLERSRREEHRMRAAIQNLLNAPVSTLPDVIPEWLVHHLTSLTQNLDNDDEVLSTVSDDDDESSPVATTMI